MHTVLNRRFTIKHEDFTRFSKAYKILQISVWTVVSTATEQVRFTATAILLISSTQWDQLLQLQRSGYVYADNDDFLLRKRLDIRTAVWSQMAYTLAFIFLNATLPVVKYDYSTWHYVQSKDMEGVLLHNEVTMHNRTRKGVLLDNVITIHNHRM